jgi:uncharacterized protein YjdB
MAKPLINKTKSGIPLQEIELALTEGAKCGMGINFKRGYITLSDYNSLSGDIDGYKALYIANGSIEIDTIANVETILNNYCKNAAVSATGATITGCTVGAIMQGTTVQLTAVVLPTGALQTGTWTTSDALVATVSSTGLVTAATGGSATITFTSTDGAFTATCVIETEEP